MFRSKYRFSLDIKLTQSQVSIPVMLNDTIWGFLITLIDEGKACLLPEGCRAVFVAKKPDGNTLFNDCIIEKNHIVRYDFTPNTANVEGTTSCEIRVYGPTGRMLTCPRFTMVVDARVILDDDIIFSDSEKTTIDSILASETQRELAEAQRVLAEAQRVLAEEQRKEADANRAEEDIVAVAINSGGKRRPFVTFVDDDGRKGVMTKLLPISQKYGVPFCSAMITSWIGSGEQNMTADDLRTLQDAGWEISSHTHDHAMLGNNKNAENPKTEDPYEPGEDGYVKGKDYRLYEEQSYQLQESKDALAAIGIKCDSVCYPGGNRNDDTFELVRKLGYKYARGSNSGRGLMLNTSPLNTYDLVSMPYGLKLNNLPGKPDDYPFDVRSMLHFEYMVKKAVKENAWLIFTVHCDEWGVFMGNPPEVMNAEDYDAESDDTEWGKFVKENNAKKEEDRVDVSKAVWHKSGKYANRWYLQEEENRLEKEFEKLICYILGYNYEEVKDLKTLEEYTGEHTPLAKIETMREVMKERANLFDVGNGWDYDATVPHFAVGIDGSASSNHLPFFLAKQNAYNGLEKPSSLPVNKMIICDIHRKGEGYTVDEDGKKKTDEHGFPSGLGTMIAMRLFSNKYGLYSKRFFIDKNTDLVYTQRSLVNTTYDANGNATREDVWTEWHATNTVTNLSNNSAVRTIEEFDENGNVVSTRYELLKPSEFASGVTSYCRISDANIAKLFPEGDKGRLKVSAYVGSTYVEMEYITNTTSRTYRCISQSAEEWGNWYLVDSTTATTDERESEQFRVDAHMGLMVFDIEQNKPFWLGVGRCWYDVNGETDKTPFDVTFKITAKSKPENDGDEVKDITDATVVRVINKATGAHRVADDDGRFYLALNYDGSSVDYALLIRAAGYKDTLYNLTLTSEMRSKGEINVSVEMEIDPITPIWLNVLARDKTNEAKIISGAYVTKIDGKLIVGANAEVEDESAVYRSVGQDKDGNELFVISNGMHKFRIADADGLYEERNVDVNVLEAHHKPAYGYVPIKCKMTPAVSDDEDEMNEGDNTTVTLVVEATDAETGNAITDAKVTSVVGTESGKEIEQNGDGTYTLQYNWKYDITIKKEDYQSKYLTKTMNTKKSTMVIKDIILSKMAQGSDNEENLKFDTVNFGDSIFGRREYTTISEMLSDLTGKTVLNAGLGGTSMSRTDGVWGTFAMRNIVDAIYADKVLDDKNVELNTLITEAGGTVNDDGTVTHPTSDVTIGTITIPKYFSETLTALRDTDFSTVTDITINHGTNDWSRNVSIGKYKSNMRYVIDKLKAICPNATITVVGIINRFDDNVNTKLDATELMNNNDSNGDKVNDTVKDFIVAQKAVAEEMSVDYIDLFTNDPLNFNKNTASTYYADGTHPNRKGNEVIAEYLANTGLFGEVIGEIPEETVRVTFVVDAVLNTDTNQKIDGAYVESATLDGGEKKYYPLVGTTNVFDLPLGVYKLVIKRTGYNTIENYGCTIDTTKKEIEKTLPNVRMSVQSSPKTAKITLQPRRRLLNNATGEIVKYNGEFVNEYVPSDSNLVFKSVTASDGTVQKPSGDDDYYHLQTGTYNFTVGHPNTESNNVYADKSSSFTVTKDNVDANEKYVEPIMLASKGWDRVLINATTTDGTSLSGAYITEIVTLPAAGGSPDYCKVANEYWVTNGAYKIKVACGGYEKWNEPMSGGDDYVYISASGNAGYTIVNVTMKPT